MNSTRKEIFSSLARTCLAMGMVAASFVGAVHADGFDRHEFRVSSTTFQNGTILPIIMIDNAEFQGVNVCSVDGSPGGDQSPELSWTHAPRDTRSFVVILYDTTAAFTHWGIYNIPGTAAGLPQNAGVAGNAFGDQINNDFPDPAYDGPCPPNTLTPYLHQYVFTVYALDTDLEVLPASNFAQAETLYHVFIRAAGEGHILDSASIVGYYSTVPGQMPPGP